MEDDVAAKVFLKDHSIPDGLFFPTLESKRLRPLIRMTQQLTEIYHEINRTEDFEWFRRRNKSYICRIGDIINNGRFSIIAHLGRGAFGQVDKAQDLERPEAPPVAIKVYDRSFKSQANAELNILRDLRAKDPFDQYNIVTLYDAFQHLEHLCLVFECLSMNLYQYLKKTGRIHNNREGGFHGVSLNLVKIFARQLLMTLDFFSRPDIRVIHCDLKPENIMLCDPRYSRIKVIDFSSSFREHQVIQGIVQSRFYRAPEVLLGIMPLSLPIDMWSLGCILFEMHTGEALIEGWRDEEQIFLISELLGAVPASMVLQSSFREAYFEQAESKWILRAPTTIFGQQSRRGAMYDSRLSFSSRIRKRTLTESIGNYDLFEDLLKKMLTIDPLERISPGTALNHPLFCTTTQGEPRELKEYCACSSSNTMI